MSRMRADNGTAQERLSQVADHMSGGSSASKKGKSSLLQKNPDDVCAIPTAISTRSRTERSVEYLDPHVPSGNVEHYTDSLPGRCNMRSPHSLH
jgi:hypothetical protein